MTYLYEDISPEERVGMLDKVAGQVVKYHMATPAIVFIESTKYLNRVGSQFLIFLSPVVNAIFTAWELEKFAVVLEERENVEYLLDKIEELDAELREKEKKERLERKAQRKRKKSLFKKIFGK